MPLFSEAFNQFRQSGSFHLNDTFINLRQFEDLVSYIRDKPSRISKWPSRQFHLNQVELIPYYASEMCEPGGPPENLYSVRIATVESLLRILLDFHTIWDSIELNGVYSRLNERNIPLNPKFFTEFKSSSDVLRKLTIKTVSLEQESLIKILDIGFALEVLNLEIDWSANDYDWEKLSDKFIEHSYLKYLDFGTTPLDTAAYSALSQLLDANYRIEKINLPEPVGDLALMEIYQQINQRLLDSCWIRFKKEQLSQQRLLHVALNALAEVKVLRIEQQKGNLDSWDEGDIDKLNRRFDFLLSSQTALALTNYEKEAWLKKDTYVLPRVYRDYSAYVKEYSALFQLHLETFFPAQGKTAGYLLLEKALETKNAEAIGALLKAKVNLFEIPAKTEKPFLKRALQGRKRSEIKNLLLWHIIRGNSNLMESVVEHFSEHSQLHDVLRELIDHLSQYGDILIYKNDLPGLYFFTKDIVNLCRKMFRLEPPSEKRGEEYAGFQLDLYKSIQVATVNGQERPNPDSLSHMQKIVREMKDNSSSALRGFLKGSVLHTQMLVILDKLDVELGKITGITNDPVEQASIIAKQRNDLAEQRNTLAEQRNALKEKDTTINDLIETAAREKVAMHAKLAEKEKQFERLNNLVAQKERPRSNSYFFSGW